MTKARDLANASTALSAVSATELGYLDGVTSAVQTQIDSKQATISGVDNTEIGYLNGVTSAIQTQLDAKAVYPSQTGNSGKYLTTNGSATSWGTVASAPDFIAGKNKIINGDFGIWQRGTSITLGAGSWTYHCDRFSAYQLFSSGSLVLSRQAFTPGTAPVAGYEGNFFLRATAPTSSTGELNFRTNVENVTTFAGQTVTFSFWAKASGTTAANLKIVQDFGSGGSSRVDSAITSISIGTSWARYSMTVTLASIAGKTIGTGSFLDAYFYTNSAFTGGATIDFWGWQLEAGPVATPFTTATGTIQGELAACHRYYYQIGPGAAYASFGIGGFHTASNSFMFIINTPVVMRVVPTFTTSGNLQTNGTGITLTGLGFNGTYSNSASYNGQANCSGATTGFGSSIRNDNDTTAKIMFSSEL